MLSRIAIIGCGRIGFLLEGDPLRYKPCTHYGGCISAGLKIDYACDIDGKRLGLFSRTAGIPLERCFHRSSDLIRAARPDAVIIATWTESHDAICIDALKNGARLIVLEKPVASSLKKGDRILKACSARGAALIVNHERRYDNRYRTLRRLIEGGAIGAIKTVHASILTAGYRGKSEIGEGGGPLLHDGTHLVDIIRYLFGEIASVEGEFSRVGRRDGYEDRAAAWMKCASGVDIFLEAGGSRNYFIFELEISGTEGKLLIGNGYEKFFRKRRSRFYTGFNDLEERKFPVFRKNNPFTDLYREVAGILKNPAGPVSSSGTDGYRALEVIHAIYLSSYKGKRIDLPVRPSQVSLRKIFSLGK